MPRIEEEPFRCLLLHHVDDKIKWLNKQRNQSETTLMGIVPLKIVPWQIKKGETPE